MLSERYPYLGSGRTTHPYGLKIDAYLDVPPPTKGAGAPDEPTPHYYYHQPLHELFDEAFAAELVVDSLEELAFRPQGGEVARTLSWSSLPQISPVFIARLRAHPDIAATGALEG